MTSCEFYTGGDDLSQALDIRGRVFGGEYAAALPDDAQCVHAVLTAGGVPCASARYRVSSGKPRSHMWACSPPTAAVAAGQS